MAISERGGSFQQTGIVFGLPSVRVQVQKPYDRDPRVMDIGACLEKAYDKRVSSCNDTISYSQIAVVPSPIAPN